MRENVNRRLLALAACGLVGGLASATNAQTVINISGATLFENFLKAPASTNDYLDVDGDGFARINNTNDQLAPFGLPPALGAGQNGQWWVVQYRETGSVAGLQELIDFGSTFVQTTPGPLLPSLSSKSFMNGTQFLTNGACTNAICNTANPGSNPCCSNFASPPQATYSVPGLPSVGGIRIDMAPLDIPSVWAVQNFAAGTAGPTKAPATGQYGRNGRVSVNTSGTSTNAGLPNLLADLGPRNLNVGSPDSNTIFDTQVAAVPIAAMVNLGVGMQQIKMSDLRHLTATGRLPTGENLTMVTRDAGSGTRNGFCNAIGLDPSWGVGENVGGQFGVGGSVAANEMLVGPSYVPGNKVGSGDMENTMINTRLGVGYSGAERGINSTWLSGGKLECLAVQNDLYGGTTYARPTIGNVLHNTANGYVITGAEQFATLGDPRSAPIAKGGDVVNTNPDMPNVEAAAYLNNITKSVTAFSGAPGGSTTLFTPGEFLATQFILVAATDNIHSLTAPTTLVANPALNVPLQTYISSVNVLGNAAYATFGTVSLNGLNPNRQVLAATYSDQALVPGGGNFISQGGAALNNGQPCLTRNRIAGDFNGDGKRDLNDAIEMLKAFRSRNGGPAWVAPSGTGAIAGAPGTDACIEILGDFNGDGSFNAKDIRYWADGLAIDPVTLKLDRKKGFEAIDNAWQTLTGSNNFFGTTKSSGPAYAAGESRFDVSGAPGIAPGWAPVGADGVIDATDVNYVAAQFINNSFITDGHANWDNLAEAVGFDLSADMTGDNIVDQADLDAINAALGGAACYANCDGSTSLPLLTANDFQCFLNAFAQGAAYANCDGSQTIPVLTANDFQCFLNKYAAGCS